MCLIVFDWRPDAADGPLFTLAANRDEFFRRTAEPIHWWTDAPAVLAGRDLLGGGTWLGVSRDGRFAALTNYRAPEDRRTDAPTRGTLVSDWLSGGSTAQRDERNGSTEPDDTPLDYLNRVAETGHRYNGFNLLIGDWTRRELGWYCNRGNRGNRGIGGNRDNPGNRPPAAPALLTAGTYGISNAVLDTAWPKLVGKRAELSALLAREAAPPLERLIDLMRDPRIARDDELPSTGITLDLERALSAAFIDTPEYGTRSTTALRVEVNKVANETVTSVTIAERSDDDGSHRIVRPGDVERSFAFHLEPGPPR